MSNNSVSWVGTISEELEDRGPVSFTRHTIGKQKHLFAHRCALFYTPTQNFPVEHVGSGPLDIMLPLALDALKVRTTGRRDRIYLYYFGAIVDDGPAFIDVSWDQELVGHPKDAGVRIRVLPKAANQSCELTVRSARPVAPL